MAVAVILEWTGATLDQYDAVNESMGFAPGAGGPPGLLFHWAASSDDGIRITDVWESAEQFQRFVEERIHPATERIGIETEPTMTVVPVHNHLTAG